MRLVKSATALLAASSLFVLSACGGGGGGDAPTAEGVYSGSITGSVNTAFQLLMLENGEYWALYGTSSGGVFFVDSFVQGNATYNGSSFSSTDGKDFGYTTPLAVNVSANFVANTSVSGTISASGASASFSGTVTPATTFNYATPARLSDVSGSWSLNDDLGNPVSVTISAAGVVSGTSLGCNFTGSMAPRASGKNVFDFTVTFGGAPCVLPGQSARGVGVTSVLSGTATRQLVLAGVNTSRTAGSVLFGVR